MVKNFEQAGYLLKVPSQILTIVDAAKPNQEDRPEERRTKMRDRRSLSYETLFGREKGGIC